MLYEWYKTTAYDMENLNDALCVFCVASCEQHSDYLPVGTDGYIGEQIMREAAQKANCKAILLPMLYYGYSPHHRAFKGFITLKQDTLKATVKDICTSVCQSGIKHILIINAHGGNQSFLQAAVNELGEEYGIFPVLLRYWDLIASEIKEIRESASGGMGHACELETSLMMNYYPELVHEDRIKNMSTAEGNMWHKPEMFAKNSVYIYKPFDRYSSMGNIGQAQFASADKGRLISQAVTDKLAKLMEYCSEHDF